MKRLMSFFTILLALTFLNVNAESGGGRHDSDGAVCTDSSCSSSILCNGNTYDSSCKSLMSSTLGASTRYKNYHDYLEDIVKITPQWSRKVDMFNQDYSITAIDNRTISDFKPIVSDVNKMDRYRWHTCSYSYVSWCTDSSYFSRDKILGGFYSNIIYSYYSPSIHYRLQYNYIISASNGEIDFSEFKNPKSFDLSEFQNNAYIIAYNSNNESFEDSSSAIDNWQITYAWRQRDDGTVRLTIYADFVPREQLNAVIVGDSILPTGDLMQGFISNVYFASNKYGNNLEIVEGNSYLFRYTDSQYTPINEENYITFLSDGSISFENKILSCSITDISCHIKNLGTVFNGLLTGVQNILNDIYNFLTNIFTTIVNAISSAMNSLFVPSTSDFQNVHRQFNTFIDEHFGILALPLHILSNFYNMILELIVSPKEFIITFNDIGLGDMGTIIPGGSYDVGSFLSTQPYKTIYDTYYAFTYILVTYWFLLFLDRVHKRVFGGV